MSEEANAPKVEETPKAPEQTPKVEETPKAKTPKAKAEKAEKPKKDWKVRFGKLEPVLNRG
jgi:hypothetical protein